MKSKYIKSAICLIAVVIVIISLWSLLWLGMQKDHIPQTMQTAQKARRSGQDQQAAKACLEVLREDPHNLEAMRLLASISRDQGNYAAAAEYSRQAAKMEPGNRELIKETILNWLGAGNFQRVIDRLEPEQTRTAEFNLLLAKAYLMAGRMEDAAPLINRILKEERGNAQGRLLRAHVLFARQDIAGARDIYASLTNQQEVSSAALIGLANCALSENDTASAENYFSEIAVDNEHRFQAGFIYADHLRKTGKMKEAQAEWELLHKRYPQQAKVIIALAECLAANGESEKLEDLIEQCPVRNADDTEIKHYLQALAAYRAQQFDEAAKYLNWCRETMSDQPLYPWINLHLALEQEDEYGLIAAIQRIQQAGGMSWGKASLQDLLNAAMEKATRTGDLEFAATIARLTSSSFPDNTTAHIAAARQALIDKQYRKALQEAELVLARTPDSPAALEVRGRIYLAREQYEQALEDFTALAKQAPGIPTGLYWQGIAWYRQTNYTQAAQCLQSAYSIRPDIQTAASLYDVWLADDRTQEIRNLANELKQSKDPFEQSIGYSFDAGLAREQSKLAEAAEAYAQAIRIAPQRIPYYLSQANLLMQLQRFDDALEVLLAAQDQSPNHRYVEFMLADAYAAGGNLDEAVRQYRLVLRQHPAWALPMVNLADLLIRNKQTQREAREWAQKATRHAPDWSGAQLALARCYAELQNTEQALNLLADILKKDPENERAQALYQSIKPETSGGDE